MTAPNTHPRDRLLEALYDEVDGATMEMVDYSQVGKAIGLTDDQVSAAVAYFSEGRYLANMTFGGTATLTTAAIDEVERRRAEAPPADFGDARERLLEGIYVASEANPLKMVAALDVAHQIGIAPDAIGAALTYMGQKGWIAQRIGGRGRPLTITPLGIDNAERLRNQRRSAAPDTGTEDATPVAVVAITREQRADIEAVLTELDRADVESKLEGDDLLDYEAERRAVTSVLTATRPKRSYLKPLLQALGAFALAVGAEVVGGKLTGLL